MKAAAGQQLGSAGCSVVGGVFAHNLLGCWPSRVHVHQIARVVARVEHQVILDRPGLRCTVALIKRASRKKSIFLQTLKVGANDRSAQELQNGL